MKTKANHIFLFALYTFFALLCFTACQDEITEVDNPTEQETIDANSSLSNLLSRTTAHYGAADDILDGSSCFSVALPVTIIVSDITIMIENEEDLEQLEDLFEDLNDDEDFLDFVFPVTIIFSDYSELVIENEDQLEDLINECNDEEDIIECVDFVYPISFSVFNSEFNLIDTVTIQNDEALYNFLDELEDEDSALIVSLNYPVTLEYANGETIEINSNIELAEAIEAAEDDCEDDNICIEEDVALNLVQCPWEAYLYSNNDLENLDGPYLFTFSADGTVFIEGTSTEGYTTTWNLSQTDDGLELNIEVFYYFEAQFGTWLIVECSNDELEFIHQTVEGTGFFFEQACVDDLECSITDISSILQECPWNFTNSTGDFNNYQMIFNANGDLQITEGVATSAIGGNYNLSATDNGIILTFSELTAFQNTLDGEWLIVECSSDRIVISNGNETFVLEQDCTINNQDLLECYSLYILSQECDNDNDGTATFVFETESDQSLDCIALYPLAMSSHPTYQDAVNNTNLLNIVLTTPIDLEAQTIYIRVFSEVTSEFAIQELTITVEACNDEVFNCFGDFEIVECTQTNNVPVYNLNAGTIGLVDCMQPFVPSFHETIADAENNINAIANPEAYGTLTNQVYLRIEADSGNYQIFNVYLNTIDCNVFECFQNFDAVIEVCDNGTDGPYAYDLTMAFANCTPSADVVTYHETQADAEAGLNPIANPENYTSVAVAQTIYARVEIGNQFEIFPIQLLIVDCNSGCTEADVDAFLIDCIWNVVNYNGSDNLIEYNFDFEQNSQIVVIYTSTITIDAIWSTSQTDDGVIIEFTNVTGPNIQSITGQWLVVECEVDRLQLHRENDVMVIERTCD